MYGTVKHTRKYEKHFPKMYRDVQMAVPKSTQTRHMNGSVQATQRTTQVTPSLHLLLFNRKRVGLLSEYWKQLCADNKKRKRCRDGVTCVVLCVACTLPSIYIVCVVFGTAIPTSLYIFGKCFSYLYNMH